MKRKTYGRDRGLTLRVLFTRGLVGLLYVVFAVVLISVLKVGVAPMLVSGVGLAVVQYWTSDKRALAASGAKIVSPDEAPELHAMVERLCAMAGLPKPRVAIIDTDGPNAFATGPDPKHPAIAVTNRLWRRLQPQEARAVPPHALPHLANRDLLAMTVSRRLPLLSALITP